METDLKIISLGLGGIKFEIGKESTVIADSIAINKIIDALHVFSDWLSYLDNIKVFFGNLDINLKEALDNQEDAFTEDTKLYYASLELALPLMHVSKTIIENAEAITIIQKAYDEDESITGDIEIKNIMENGYVATEDRTVITDFMQWFYRNYIKNMICDE